MKIESSLLLQPPLLSRIGETMRRKRCLIIGVQWAVVVFYLVLVTVPAFLSLPSPEARMLEHFTLFAQFLFWGVWWPFVILSVMLMGRVWCGVFCPEGALTEFVSRYGLGRSVPRWMKWGGWPFVAFILTTVYGQLVSVYEYPKAALLVLGGSTVAAIAIGLVYGKGKRVWCRHLCPVTGVFGLLARLAPLHFSVDRERWNDRIQPGMIKIHPVPVECAPLVDIRRMKGASECHMCGRCSGHRGAVSLSARMPGQEVVRLSPQDVRPWEVRLLIFGIIGVAVGAFQWSASPWFVAAKTWAAEWLVDRDSFALLQDNAPWWLLTHYPQTNDVFTWLDGLGILSYIGATALLVGGWVWGWLRVAGTILPGDAVNNARRLAYSLIPLGGVGVFLGLSAMTVSHLAAEGIHIPWLGQMRAALLGLAALWSWALAFGMLRHAPSDSLRWLAGAGVAMAIAGVITPWAFLFYIW
ncbi:MAG: 4Fe-4S binding protein [Sulfuricella denitrificans]|nr:4Fe-4S binding protein [Sulfuricella denitrificans]